MAVVGSSHTMPAVAPSALKIRAASRPVTVFPPPVASVTTTMPGPFSPTTLVSCLIREACRSFGAVRPRWAWAKDTGGSVTRARPDSSNRAGASLTACA